MISHLFEVNNYRCDNDCIPVRDNDRIPSTVLHESEVNPPGYEWRGIEWRGIVYAILTGYPNHGMQFVQNESRRIHIGGLVHWTYNSVRVFSSCSSQYVRMTSFC